MIKFNKIFGVVLVLIAGMFAVVQTSFANETKKDMKYVLVLSDRVEQANTKYFIYPQVSEMIASDIINRLNTDGDVKAPLLSDIRAELRTPDLIRASYSLLDNYRTTYDINYSALRKIAKHFDVNNVLLVTGSMDTTSDFLKPTWWAFLNVPGENVVKSEFKLYTYVALVDLNSETITWQNVYERNLEAPEFGMANLNYSPDAKQMTRVKVGSQLIAKDIAFRVESVLTPDAVVDKEPPTVHELVKLKINKKYKESVQNINNFKKKAVKKVKSLREPKNEVVENATGRIEENENNIEVENEVPAVQFDDGSKEQDAILNFVKQTEDKNIEQKKLNKKVKEVTEEKSVNLEPQKTVPDMELRPAIETDKNIKINPINIIIPKM